MRCSNFGNQILPFLRVFVVVVVAATFCYCCCWLLSSSLLSCVDPRVTARSLSGQVKLDGNDVYIGDRVSLCNPRCLKLTETACLAR